MSETVFVSLRLIHAMSRGSVARRFARHVDMSGPLCPDGSRCHIWIGAVTGRGRATRRGGPGGGYGTIHVAGRTEKAHRVAYWLHSGRWPSGIVLHACDEPRCVNPKHLSDGTHSQNLREAYARNRR